MISLSQKERRHLLRFDLARLLGLLIPLALIQTMKGKLLFKSRSCPCLDIQLLTLGAHVKHLTSSTTLRRLLIDSATYVMIILLHLSTILWCIGIDILAANSMTTL